MTSTTFSEPRRFAFVVQGEGRGHLTQAIALKSMLERRGHVICVVMVGRSPFRTLPAFFEEKIGQEIIQYDSPNFIRDQEQKGIRVGRTVTYNLKNIPTFSASLSVIHAGLERSKPDVIVNFYEVLFGIYSVIYQPKASIICLGNQYLNGHPDYPYPPRAIWNKFLYKMNTWVTGLRCQRYLALSLIPRDPTDDPFLEVVPPILREEIFKLQASQGDHFLVYILNEGYFEELQQWHQRNPGYTIHAFWDKQGVPDPYVVNEKLYFHQISESKFLELMASCRGVATTAGFQAVGEAIILGKPVLSVPTRNHFEQRCNAIEVDRSGVGIASRTFDLDRLIEFERSFQPDEEIKQWILESESRIVEQLMVSVENETFSRFLTKLMQWIFRSRPEQSGNDEPAASSNRS